MIMRLRYLSLILILVLILIAGFMHSMIVVKVAFVMITLSCLLDIVLYLYDLINHSKKTEKIR